MSAGLPPPHDALTGSVADAAALRRAESRQNELFAVADQPPDEFALCSQLQELLFAEGETLPEAALAQICGAAFGGGSAYLWLGDAATVAAAWQELRAAAASAGRPVAGQPAASGLARQIGVELVFAGRRIGFLGIASQEDAYGPASLCRLATFGALLAAMLDARSVHQERRAALAHNEYALSRQTQILDQISDSVITLDTLGYITGWNKGAERLFGYTGDEAIGRNILILYADGEEDEEDFYNAFLENGSREMTVRRRKKSGELFWASVSLSVSFDAAGNPNGFIGYLVDITDRLEAAEKLRLYARIFASANEAILVMDAAGSVISVNRAFTHISEFAEGEVLHKPLAAIDCGLQQAAEAGIQEELSRRGHWSGELTLQRKGGDAYPSWVSLSLVPGERSLPAHTCFIFSDITERRQAEAQIHRLAYYDTLTGLPNRSLLNLLLEQAVTEAQRRRGYGAVLFVDLDRFKHINDSFGHAPADLLLVEVARRLTACLRKEDVVSHPGSDEFVVALFDVARPSDAALVARKLLGALARPFVIERNEILLSASIGIAIFPDDGSDAATLVRNADIAMYRAKQLGSGSFLHYAREMNLRSLERLKLESSLRRAIEREEFVLHFQPQLDLASERIIGAEALLRWQPPNAPQVSPAEFIPLAEETGLIVPIGRWVIDTVCRQLRAWIDAGLDPVKVAVNLSPRQFSDGLPASVSAALAAHGVPAHLFEVEITEGMLMHSADPVVAMMREFAAAGISMSLDDFGTGYSSLSYLKRFPIDTLKIDQSFVRGIPHDGDDSAIASAIIGMAKALRLRVIAEGVETVEQKDFLKHAGCDEIQGYWFSRPLPAEKFAELLR